MIVALAQPAIAARAVAPRTPRRARQQRRVDRVIDQQAAIGEAGFERVMRLVLRDLTDAELRALVADGRAAEVLLPDGVTREMLEQMLTDAARAGVAVEAGHVGPGIAEPAAAVAGRPTVPRLAAEWAERRAAEAVTEVLPPSQQAIRDVIATGLRNRASVETIARRLRSVVGVHSRNVAPIERLRENLTAKGLPAERVEAAVARRYQQAVRSRAHAIAQTEVTAAVDQGRRGLWDQLARDGLVDPATVIRIWITQRDGRVDTKICLPLDGAEARGTSGAFPGGLVGPPAHVACRCVVVYEGALA